MSESALQGLREEIRAFVEERDWSQFHSPKNLSMAMMVEAAEVAEHFQWLTPGESEALDPSRRAEVAMELADVLIYLVRLADRLGVDLEQAARDKLVINREKYPAAKVRGSARKYSDYER